MKLALNVKNTSRALKPSVNDVILYDGQDWYVTRKEDLLREELKLLDDCKSELKRVQKENDDFKVEVAKQLLEMSELIKKLYSKE